MEEHGVDNELCKTCLYDKRRDVICKNCNGYLYEPSMEKQKINTYDYAKCNKCKYKEWVAYEALNICKDCNNGDRFEPGKATVIMTLDNKVEEKKASEIIKPVTEIVKSEVIDDAEGDTVIINANTSADDEDSQEDECMDEEKIQLTKMVLDLTDKVNLINLKIDSLLANTLDDKEKVEVKMNTQKEDADESPQTIEHAMKELSENLKDNFDDMAYMACCQIEDAFGISVDYGKMEDIIDEMVRDNLENLRYIGSIISGICYEAYKEAMTDRKYKDSNELERVGIFEDVLEEHIDKLWQEKKHINGK